MSRFIPFILLSALIFAMVGCSSQPKIQKGDKLIAQEDIKESAETQWDGYVDGFDTVIPKGTVLKVLYTPPPTGNVVECIPVEVNGKNTAQEVENFFVPENIRNTVGYKGYSFSLKTDYIGTKVKLVKAK